MRLLDDRVVVRVIGDDRVSFLHGMCSADIKGLKADAVAMGLFLTEHAHVIADFFAYGTDENALLLELDQWLGRAPGPIWKSSWLPMTSKWSKCRDSPSSTSRGRRRTRY